MARLHSSLGDRTTYTPQGVAKADGTKVQVFEDEQCTVPANLAAYDPASPGAPGAPVPGAELTVDAWSNRPKFWDLNDRDYLWVVAGNGPAERIQPDHQPQVTALAARVGAVENTAGAAETPAGAQDKADAAQAAAIAASAQRAANLSDVANAGTARTNLGLGGAATRDVGTAAGTVAAGDAAAAVVQLSAGNGTDDTNMLNALLAASAGKRVRGLPGATYLISAPLVVYSGTELDMTGCTVTLKANSNCNLLNNRAVGQVRRLLDAAMTSGSATLTSATGAFSAGDAGKAIVVQGAGASGVALSTTVQAVTNATTVTLAAAASTTVSGQYAAVGPRDSAITIRGGTWVRPSPNGANNGWEHHSIRLRHVDGLRLLGVRVETAVGKYAVSLGDCTRYSVERIDFAAFSDGVHIQGPAQYGYVGHVRGSTGDDMVAVTPRDWTAYDDVFGPVSDLTVEDISGVSTAAALLKVLGGSPLTSVRRIRAHGISGQCANHAVILGDDAAQANTTGGVVDEITVEGVAATMPNDKSAVQMEGNNLRRLRVNGVTYDNAASTRAAVRVSGSTTLIESLVVEGVDVRASGGPIVEVASATVARLIADRITVSTPSAGSIVSCTGTITDLTVSKVTASLTGSTNVVWLPSTATTARIDRLTISDVHCVGTGGALIDARVSTQTLPRAEIANVTMTGVGWLADLGTATELHLSNVTLASPGAGMFNVRATAALTIRGAGLNLAPGAQNIAVAAGGTATSKTFALECDLADLQRTAGSQAYNTNAGLSCGVGPVVSDGTTWKHLHTGATY